VSRTFGLVDEKLFEADFFLDKLTESSSDWFASRCYVSAFISAARSVTFALQATLRDLCGFGEWYETKQLELRSNPTARFFGRARTDSQHIGINPLNSSSSRRRDDGGFQHLYFFTSSEVGSEVPDCPDVDAVTACREYMVLIVMLILECYERFGTSIDPALYYTTENLRKLGLTVEDVEESFGFPRGWTRVRPGDMDDEQRLRVLSKEAGSTAIDELFMKYLGRSR
jgi:hypothetical protein